MEQQHVSWETYDKSSTPSAKPFPPQGDYFLQLPTLTPALFIGPDGKELRGKDNQLMANIVDPITIIGGEFAGYGIKYTRISNKRYANRNASQMGDFILSCQSPFRPQSDDQWKQAVLACSNGTFTAFCDWDAWDKVTKTSFAETMDEFPMVNGLRQRWFEVEDPTAPQGKRRVWANLRIKYYRIP